MEARSEKFSCELDFWRLRCGHEFRERVLLLSGYSSECLDQHGKAEKADLQDRTMEDRLLRNFGLKKTVHFLCFQSHISKLVNSGCLFLLYFFGTRAQRTLPSNLQLHGRHGSLKS